MNVLNTHSYWNKLNRQSIVVFEISEALSEFCKSYYERNQIKMLSNKFYENISSCKQYQTGNQNQNESISVDERSIDKKTLSLHSADVEHFECFCQIEKNLGWNF